MKLERFKARTEELALEKARIKYGDTFTVLSHREESQGLLGFFIRNHIITVGVEEESDNSLDKHIVAGELEKDNYCATPSKVEVTSNIDTGVLEDINKQLISMKADMELIRSDRVEQLKKTDKLRVSVEGCMLDCGIRKEILDKNLRTSNVNDTIVSLVSDFSGKICKIVDMEISEMPKIVFFVGSTGVGKTTTIAKVIANKVLNENKKVVLFTADTYRIAAVEQLKTYAEILSVPIEVLYEDDDINSIIDKWRDSDYIFIDTAGRSHKNKEQVNSLCSLVDRVKDKLILLVLNVNTRHSDLMDILDTYKNIKKDMELIVTKLDETNEIGNIVNIANYSEIPIRYITNGQNVPDDIELFNGEKFIDTIIEGISL